MSFFNEDDAPAEVPAEAIDFLCSFTSAVIDQADRDGVLFDMITSWEPERQVLYQQAVFIHHATLNDN